MTDLFRRSDAQDWDHWISELVDRGVNLSCWEQEFLDSLLAQRRRGYRGLTEKQAETLERIYSARTP